MNGANISPSFYSFFIFFSIFVFILLLLSSFLSILLSSYSFFPILFFFLLFFFFVCSSCLYLCFALSFLVFLFSFLLFCPSFFCSSFYPFSEECDYSKSSISTTSSIFPNFMPTFSKHDFCSKPNEACIFMLASLSPVMQAIRATNPRWRHSSISMCMSCVPMPRRSMPGAR